jgi:hypothetical protein
MTKLFAGREWLRWFERGASKVGRWESAEVERWEPSGARQRESRFCGTRATWERFDLRAQRDLRTLAQLL